MAQDVHAKAHVGAAENRDFPAGFLDHLQFRLVITGRTQHGRHFFFPYQLQKLRQRRGTGEVDQYVGLLRRLIESSHDGVIRRLTRIGHVHAADDLYLRLRGCGGHFPAHAAQCAAKENFHRTNYLVSLSNGEGQSMALSLGF